MGVILPEPEVDDESDETPDEDGTDKPVMSQALKSISGTGSRQ